MRAYRFRQSHVMLIFFLMVALSACSFFIYRVYERDAASARSASEGVAIPASALETTHALPEKLLPTHTESIVASTPAGVVTAAGTLVQPLSGAQEAASFRLERERQRSATQAELKTLLEDRNLGSVQRDTFQNKLVRLYEEAEMELRAEQLLQSKGFDGAMLIRGEQYYTVIVPRNGLTAAETTQIAELVARVAGVPATEIVIVERSN